MEQALLIVSIAIALRGLHRDGLLEPARANGIAGRGADVIELLGIVSRLEDEAEIRERLGEPGVADLHVRAAGMERLALELLDAGGWLAVFDAAPDHARNTWEALAADLSAAHAQKVKPAPDGIEVQVDMARRTMHVRMSMRPLLDRWWIGRLFGPGRPGHRWPMVGGKIHGDPRSVDGDEVMIVAVVEGQTARGLSGLDYELGRPA
ncbi:MULTISPECIES: hypothetical protein [Methylopilaceae]|uniref:Uncharacterized protein n=2 Tax=Methylopilaceae TaxID=3149309 RepID=A0A4Q0M9V7_9HYPH|nr:MULTISPECIES: hypothetical protein [Methylocystaceae]QZO00592.1 hypothetical protein K6K41_02380 [Chenggangzhangella methanolivorans]RXF69944.1 hypothetical protein EK403_17580 [Hansschlegelia zhihuaiae]